MARETATKRIGRAIRDRRTSLNMTLQELGERAGVDWSQLAKIERGVERTTVDQYETIALKLGTTLADLAARPLRRSV